MREAETLREGKLTPIVAPPTLKPRESEGPRLTPRVGGGAPRLKPRAAIKQTYTMKPKATPTMRDSEVTMQHATYVMAPQREVAMRQSISLLLDRGVTRLMEQGQAKPRKVFYMPTVQLEKPVFAVVSQEQFDPDNNFNADQAYEWTTSSDKVLEDAIDAAKEQQNDAYTDIVWTQNAEIVLVGVDGKHYTGQIEDEDIQDFVDEVSHASSDPDSKWEKKEVRVTWHPDDEPEFMNVPDSISYGELAEQWGVTPDQFEVRVVMIRDGHNSSLGYTTPLSAYSGKYDKWELTGHYISEFSHREQIEGASPLIKFYDAFPDVEMEPFGETEPPDWKD